MCNKGVLSRGPLPVEYFFKNIEKKDKYTNMKKENFDFDDKDFELLKQIKELYLKKKRMGGQLDGFNLPFLKDRIYILLSQLIMLTIVSEKGTLKSLLNRYLYYLFII